MFYNLLRFLLNLLKELQIFKNLLLIFHIYFKLPIIIKLILCIDKLKYLRLYSTNIIPVLNIIL